MVYRRLIVYFFRFFLPALIICVAGNGALQAQFNDSVHYYTKFSTTGIINKTKDSRSFVMNNGFSFNVSKKKVSLNSSAGYIYGRQNGTLTNNDFTTGLNVDLLKNTHKLYYWGLVNLTSSYSLKINHQVQAGGGVGYSFLNREKAELVVSDGLLYEASSVKTEAGTNDTYQTVRNSLRVRHRWLINDVISWDGTHFWQPSLERIDDYIIKSSTSVSIRLRKWLSITSALTYNKFSRTGRENLLVSFGLTAETYF
ncbi:MAG: DUF481 domain-containing protein [Chitinophagaceae bacterium]|nr:DUF481 domain-containing protein [Chitinophagaceae bacterium]